MAIAACSVGHRSALHRALQRAAFFRASFCTIGGMALSVPFQIAGAVVHSLLRHGGECGTQDRELR